MGKDLGFLEYQRKENMGQSCAQRIIHFDEFHTPLDQESRRQQGARCMDCGVPFCQSGMILNNMATGCPLHNLIPEWNDLVYRDKLQQAYVRLHKTNNFPEFTARVCPALCEKACTCGLNGDSVTVKENEYAIIENAYEKGYVQPIKNMIRSGKRVAIIGSGPSGLTLADQLNHRGHEVDVYERDDRIGGLLMYGIPNMKLEKKVIERRIDIMKKEGVNFFTNQSIDSEEKAQELLEKYDAIALACGSRKARNINVENREGKNIHFALEYLSASTKSVLDKLEPSINASGKDVIVIGGGDTGNDCVGTAIRQGCASVIQLEMMPKPPLQRAKGNEWPQYPRTLKTDYGQEEAIYVFGKDPRIFQTTVQSFDLDEYGCVQGVYTIKLQSVYDEIQKRYVLKEVEGSEHYLKAQLVLIAAGFVGCEENIVDAFHIRCTRGRVDTNHYLTSKDKVFALGDMRRGQSLVVWGIHEGRECAKAIDEYLIGYTNL